ncbi:MAG: DegT/DnrJ/EryC1/StrS family aminotransferase [Acidimicrobiaceae bacterium]|nr:DegT/DnrJ/EryC1/StrS family aminotransferase [Acidimicrobiaceae bacterium]
MIPITRVEIGPEEEAEVLEVLRSGQLAQGPKVAALEQAFVDLTGARHAIAVSNGTISLVAALQALDLAPGAEVVTSPFTFVATVNAALEAGATVRFADIDPGSYLIDPAAVADVIGSSTAVLMPVHLYGQAADIGALAPLADSVGAAVVEDAAQAHGAEFEGRRVGSFGIGSFSLYATKNVMTGEGGMITTNDDAIADRLRLLRNQGMRVRYHYEVAGHNYRLTDLQAAVGLPQMRRLHERTERRRRNAAGLSERLRGVEGLVLPTELPNRRHVWHQYTVRITADARIDRDGVIDGLGAAGIGCGIYYPKAAYDYDCYRGHRRVVGASCPEAERAAREVLSLPVHPSLTDSDLDRIAAAVHALLGDPA